METFGAARAEDSAGLWWKRGRGRTVECWGATEGAGQGAAGRRGTPERGRADSRTPARRLLGQLQPVDGEAVGATAHAAALALAPHVTLGLAHVCRLDLVAAVALGSKFQAGIQVTPGEGCGQAGAAATMQTPGTGRLRGMGGLRGPGPPGPPPAFIPTHLPTWPHMFY